MKKEEDKSITLNGILTASITEKKALDSIDPYFYIKVLLKIKLSGEKLDGLTNNTCMLLNGETTHNAQSKFIFYKPRFLFNKCIYDISNQIYTFEVAHVPRDFN